MANDLYVFRISPGPVTPPLSAEPSMYDAMEPGIMTDVVQSCWGNRRTAPPEKFNRPNVRYHFNYSSRQPALVGLVSDLAFFVAAGLKVYFSGRRYRAIVAYGPTRTALAGLLLKWLTGAKLIVEFGGDPRTAYIADSASASRTARVTRVVADAWTRFLLKWVDRAKLQFPGQIGIYPAAGRVPQTVYMSYVAVSDVPVNRGDGRYLLLLGFPWYLKGVDVLIRAFLAVTDEYPEYTLKVVGYCPDRSSFEALRGDCQRIELQKAVHRKEALELIAGCTALVVASRTEAMPRVLVEAMAAGKPVIASRVGGIPYHITDGQTGLLFESESVGELAECLRRVLGDEALRRRLGAAGFTLAHEQYSEREHLRRYGEMVRQTVRGGSEPRVNERDVAGPSGEEQRVDDDGRIKG